MRKCAKSMCLLLVTLGTLAALLAGCAHPVRNETVASSVPVTEDSDGEVSFQQVLHEFSGYSFTGQSYRIYAGEENVCNPDSFGEGNYLSDSVYRRNAAVEKLFSINIEYAPIPVGAGTAELSRQLLADWHIYGSSYDLVMLPAVTMGVLSVYEGLFADLRTVELLDLSNPWWSRSAVSELTVMDRTYLTVGAINRDAITNAGALLCNKTAFQELYPDRDLYRTVRNQQWTREELLRLSVVLPKHETVVDGYMGDHAGIAEMMLVSSGVSIFSRKSPIGYVFDAGTAGEQMTELRAWSLVPRANWKLVDDRAESLSAFHSQTTLFCSVCLGDLTEGVLDSGGFEWMLLPSPTNAEGDAYATAVGDGFSALAIPAGRGGMKSAIVLEALNAYDHYIYLPAVYNYMLSGSYSSNQREAEMMDLILDSRVFNFARIYGGNADEHAGEYFILLRSLMEGEPIHPQLESRGEQIRNHWVRVFLSFGFSDRLCAAFPYLDFGPTVIEPVE